MEIKSLDNLKRNGNVYDLYTTIYSSMDKPIGIYTFPLSDKHSMRIDLVCDDMYGNMDNIALVCNINSIMNPLTIKNGDVLYFVDEQDVDFVKSDTQVYDKIMDNIKKANVGKQTKTDPKRLDDLNTRNENEKKKNYIPPHMNSSATASMDVSNGKIKLKPNF